MKQASTDPLRLIARLGLCLAMVTTFAACSDDSDGGNGDGSQAASTDGSPSGGDEGPSTSDDPQDSTPPDAVIDVTDTPGMDDYEGAQEDVTDLECAKDGKVWAVSGTVTNPTDKPVDYRIYTSFLDDDQETLGLLQTDVDDLPPDESTEWSGELKLDASDLECVLRVERSAPGDA